MYLRWGCAPPTACYFPLGRRESPYFCALHDSRVAHSTTDAGYILPPTSCLPGSFGLVVADGSTSLGDKANRTAEDLRGTVLSPTSLEGFFFRWRSERVVKRGASLRVSSASRLVAALFFFVECPGYNARYQRSTRRRTRVFFFLRERKG